MYRGTDLKGFRAMRIGPVYVYISPWTYLFCKQCRIAGSWRYGRFMRFSTVASEGSFCSLIPSKSPPSLWSNLREGRREGIEREGKREGIERKRKRVGIEREGKREGIEREGKREGMERKGKRVGIEREGKREGLGKVKNRFDRWRVYYCCVSNHFVSVFIQIYSVSFSTISALLRLCC